MKYFICALDSTSLMSQCYLGIPADHIERIIPAALHETEGEEAFISIPALLKLKDSATPHGLVLKALGPAKTVLLSPKIDVELQIPEEDIHSLPEALAEGLTFFKGAFFTEQKVILILDPERLMEKFPNGESDD